MPKNRYKGQKKSSHRTARPRRDTPPTPQSPAPADETRKSRPMGGPAFSIGLLAILVALAASAMLALNTFEILKLPGCGVGSGCGAAAGSKFGSIPIPGAEITWPVSFIGLAYFAAVAVAWINNRKGLSTALRTVLFLGGLGSLFYVTIMFAQPDYLCIYCLITHAANFLLIGVALFAGGYSLASSSALATGATAFIVTTCALFVADRVSDVMAHQKGEQQLAESIEELKERTRQSNDANPTTTPASTQPDTPASPDDWKTDQRLTHTGRRGFTGNYLWGPENAPMRIVVFSSYQCEDCLRVHDEIKKLLEQRNDVSFSHKHFPFAAPCNPKIDPDNPKHPNSCWAARAAEAAGLLHGPEGFKTFHDWLFDPDVKGSFYDHELHAKLDQLGWDRQQFIQTMMSQKTLEIVQADVQEGLDLGLFYTPMMFVNGVQIRGFRTPNVLTRAVEALAEENPPPGSATDDFPAGKLEKYVADYFDSITNIRYGRIGRDTFRAVTGPDDAVAEIHAFMSYKSDRARELQNQIDRILDRHPDKVRVIYRHFPVSRACNEKVLESWDEGEVTCTMARAAEAAGLLYGPETFLAVHHWNLDHQRDWSLGALLAVAPDMGIDPGELQSKMDSPEVEAAIQQDIDWLISVRLGSPAAVFVNNKHVYNAFTDNLPVTETIIDRIVEQRTN